MVIGLVASAIGMGTYAYFSDTETSSGNTFTAGSIDLKIDNHCYFNGDECAWDETDNRYEWQSGPNQGEECYCTWDLTDLVGELFFNFADLKPGDYGEDTVSLHVYNNDAWGCVEFKNLESDDNTCTEPELEAESGCAPGYDGELDENLYFVFWVDDGDNVYEPGTDTILMNGSASDVLDGRTYVLADSENSNVFTGKIEPLTGSVDYYIGKMWCFGDLDWNENTPSTDWTCDGSSVGNEAQTDSLTGDIEFYVIQARNNPDFLCIT
jgi:predicted ribosomally synthesized peptide with SipW-like signal peptide